MTCEFCRRSPCSMTCCCEPCVAALEATKGVEVDGWTGPLWDTPEEIAQLNQEIAWEREESNFAPAVSGALDAIDPDHIYPHHFVLIYRFEPISITTEVLT